MAPNLLTFVFQPQDLYRVAAFEFGDKPWERDITAWITNRDPEGVMYTLDHGGQVWLHAAGDQLIGFSSLGVASWRYPEADGKRVRHSHIPAVGLLPPFRGQPRDTPSAHYSDQIIDHLIYQAGQHTDRVPLLSLYVDDHNIGAVRLYERAGFRFFPRTFTSESTGRTYRAMVLDRLT